MATGIVVSRVLLAADQQLGMEELPVVASADLVNGGGVEVDEDGAGDVFAVAGLGEESLVRAALDDVLGIGVGAAVHTEAVLEEIPVGRGWPSASSPGLARRGGVGRTAPRRCYPAGYRPGRCGGGGSREGERCQLSLPRQRDGESDRAEGVSRSRPRPRASALVSCRLVCLRRASG